MVVFDSGVKLAIVDAVHFLVVVVLAFQFVEGVAEGVSAFLVEDPGVFFVDEIVVKFNQVLYSRAICELLFWGSSELEKVGAEPDLFYMGLVAAFGYYLFDRILLFAFLMLA